MLADVTFTGTNVLIVLAIVVAILVIIYLVKRVM